MQRLPVESMTLEEVNVRLLHAFRNGHLNMDLRGVVLGFAAAIKRKTGPSVKQIELARKLVGELRHHDGSEPDDLIDWDDNEAGREMERNRDEF